MSKSAIKDTDAAIELLLTRPQKQYIKKMTALGYSRVAAVRSLLRLGILARQAEWSKDDGANKIDVQQWCNNPALHGNNPAPDAAPRPE